MSKVAPGAVQVDKYLRLQKLGEIVEVLLRAAIFLDASPNLQGSAHRLCMQNFGILLVLSFRFELPDLVS